MFPRKQRTSHQLVTTRRQRSFRYRLQSTTTKLLALVAFLLFAWQWQSADAGFDGESFLKQDMTDATQYRDFLKDKGVNIPTVPRKRADTPLRHKRRKKRTDVPLDVDKTAAETLQQGQPASYECKKLFWIVPIHKEWDMPEAMAQSLYLKLQVALLSARVHSPSLHPILLYDGPPNAFTAWWEISGGRIVFTYTSLYTHLSQCRGSWTDSESYTRMCRGSFLLLDVPAVMKNITAPGVGPDVETDYAFITGPDILFLKDIDTCKLGKPKVLAVGRDHQDSGGLSLDIAYMNVKAFGAQQENMVKKAVQDAFNYPNCAQSLVLDYLQGEQLTVLPNFFHWKGYWGGAAEVALVHFYGPKPLDCLPCLVEFPEEPNLCALTCDATARALFGFTPDKGIYYKWLMHVYWAFIETPVRYIEYVP